MKNFVFFLQKYMLAVCFLCGLIIPECLWGQFQPTIAFADMDGRMNYLRDAEGNRIANFSHAGYRGGQEEALPLVATALSISPVAGDNTAHIQAAIDQVSSFNPDSLGFRGAVELSAGRYEIHGTLYIHTDGVVLRGVGDGADTMLNTVLIGVGNSPNQRDILMMGGGGGTNWNGMIPNTASFITSDTVRVGDDEFSITNPEYYQVGDNIVITHPCTQEWLDAIDGGGAPTEGPWGVNTQPLIFNRRIVAIQDSVITLDVPLYNTLVRTLSPSFVYVYDRAGLVSEVGLEDLRIDIETAGANDEAHAWNAVGMKQIEDSWVKGCTFLHFGLAGVYTNTATRITIDSCQALDPVALIQGARMYNFNLLSASSQVLIQHCRASNGRHHYVSNGTSSVSGCVFLHCLSEGAYAASEGHRRWSMGLLYDNHTETSVRENSRILLGLYNRGDYGTAHGWSSVHSVAWNCDMGGARLSVQKPPTAQNYAIGCRGQVSSIGPFAGGMAQIEGSGQPETVPSSLYQAQLAARLAGLQEVVADQVSTHQREDFLDADWNLYPNPSASCLVIKAPRPGNFSFSIRDIHGREIDRMVGYTSLRLDYSHVPPGMYAIELIQEGHSSQQLWIKN